MKHLHVRAAGLALAAVVGFALEAEVRPLVVEGAPFPLTVAEWTPPARDFPVTDYGAKPDGTPCTEAIEAAVDAAEALCRITAFTVENIDGGNLEVCPFGTIALCGEYPCPVDGSRCIDLLLLLAGDESGSKQKCK